MTRRSSRKDLIDTLSDFVARNKGFPVFAGVGLVLISLVLNLFPALASSPGLWGWLVRSQLLLHVGIVVGLLGILIGDAL